MKKMTIQLLVVIRLIIETTCRFQRYDLCGIIKSQKERGVIYDK